MSDAVKPPEALPYLPLFMDLAGRPCLVLGSGEAAANKAALLNRASAIVHQVAASDFTPADLDGVALVVDATDDEAFTRSLATLTKMRGIPLNVVDKPDLCDFIFPAILDRSPVIVAVSTGGLAPALARLIRQRLESAIPAAFGGLPIWPGNSAAKSRTLCPPPASACATGMRCWTAAPAISPCTAARKKPAPKWIACSAAPPPTRPTPVPAWSTSSAPAPATPSF